MVVNRDSISRVTERQLIVRIKYKVLRVEWTIKERKRGKEEEHL